MESSKQTEKTVYALLDAERAVARLALIKELIAQVEVLEAPQEIMGTIWQSKRDIYEMGWNDHAQAVKKLLRAEV